MDSKKKHLLKKFIRELKEVRGRHTELVSVYIPAGYDMNKIINHLQQEQSTAVNIKDAITRKHVISSLERAIRHLRLYKKTPENGLAVFSGNISSQEGKEDIKVWSIEPPEPLQTRIYRCDQKFVLNLLEEMLQHQETYGLLVMDRREATLGLLKGTAIAVLTKLTSGVPGKFKTGGQCQHPETLVQVHTGEIKKIEELHNPHIVKSFNFNNYDLIDSRIVDKWDIIKEKSYTIITKNPRFIVECSKDHIFFVSNNEKIITKPAEELKIGDSLLFPEKITINSKKQFLKSEKYTYAGTFKGKEIILPTLINKEFAQFLGYYFWDGCKDQDSITLFEQNKDVALQYKHLIDKLFGFKSSFRFRNIKNHYQIRFKSRSLVRLIQGEFPEIQKTENSLIPSKILQSKNSILAAFIRGFFDAEGYCSKNKGIGISAHNKLLIQQLQLVLLRFGILSSFLEYDNKGNPYSKKTRYSLQIKGIESIIRFLKFIGFTSNYKKKNLERNIKYKSNTNYVRQIVSPGRKIREKIENNILPVKINKINIMNKPTKMVDIAVKNENFIANGIFVHNSAARFSRLREEMAKEFYKRIAEHVQNEFTDLKELKGIIIGGPGHTKNEFFEGDFLNNEIKKKVIGIKDIGYTDEHGLHELVDRGQDLLIKEEIAKEKTILQKFLTTLAKNPEKAAYGLEDVKKMLEMGAVETLLLSESLDEEVIDKLEEDATNFGTEVIIISVDTMEGAQLRDLGGIAAILRYEVNSAQ